MKKIAYLATVLLTLASFMTSCSDEKYDNTPYSNPVSDVAYTTTGRNLTLTWTNPEGATGTAIFRDGTQIASLGEGVNSYTVANAPVNEEHYYTVKAIYGKQGRMSEGVSKTVFIEYNVKVGYYLTAENYSDLPDDDEVAAAEWFKAQYVDGGSGVFVHASDLASLNPDNVSALWIQIDRVGIGIGWANLPFSTADIAALKAYVQDGGKLFLTKHATQLVVAIGRVEERFAPGLFGDGVGDTGIDVWCMNAVIGCRQDAAYDHRGHAAFIGLEAGDPNNYGFETYPMEGPGLREDHNCMWDLNAYGFSGTPNVVANWEAETNSTVLATWGHVSDYCCAGIIEFNPTAEFAGNIIACGLSTYEFKQNAPQEGTDNAYQKNIERFTKNCIEYLK